MNIMRAYPQRSEFPQALEEARQVALAAAKVMALLQKPIPAQDKEQPNGSTSG